VHNKAVMHIKLKKVLCVNCTRGFDYIWGSSKVAPVTEKMSSNRLIAWYGHVMQRDESHITKK
jgi:hypothetical protein